MPAKTVNTRRSKAQNSYTSNKSIGWWKKQIEGVNAGIRKQQKADDPFIRKEAKRQDAARKAEWFKNLSPAAKKKYLREHPNSKYR